MNLGLYLPEDSSCPWAGPTEKKKVIIFKYFIVFQDLLLI